MCIADVTDLFFFPHGVCPYKLWLLHIHLTIELLPRYNGNCNLFRKVVFNFCVLHAAMKQAELQANLASILFLKVSHLLLIRYSNRSW